MTSLTMRQRVLGKIFKYWLRDIGEMNSSGSNRGIFSKRRQLWIDLSRDKGSMARRPISVIDPLARRKPPEEFRDTADVRTNKSATAFNLIMGEIMMGNSQKRIAVEGARLVEDALLAGLKMEKLFLLRSLKELSPGLNHFLLEEQQQLKTGVGSGSGSPEIHRIGQKVMQTWSSVTTPPGVIGIFLKPKLEESGSKLTLRNESNFPVTVICDNIREPGNLGSILRSASAAGCKQLYLTKGCVDPWNMKVLRGACGAHFRVPLKTDLSEPLLSKLIVNKTMPLTPTGSQQQVGIGQNIEDRSVILICDSNAIDPRINLPSTSYRDVKYSDYAHLFLVIGGETTGISDKIIETTNAIRNIYPFDFFRIRIPLANNIESLNAANTLGIVIFEIVRQLDH